MHAAQDKQCVTLCNVKHRIRKPFEQNASHILMHSGRSHGIARYTVDSRLQTARKLSAQALTLLFVPRLRISYLYTRTGTKNHAQHLNQA
jgi:hypothetical protein